MVKVSVTLDDLDTIIKALDSADFYCEDASFYEHLSELRFRLQKVLKKHEAIKNIDDRLKWNRVLLRLGTGFNTIDDYEKARDYLLSERERLIKSKEV